MTWMVGESAVQETNFEDENTQDITLTLSDYDDIGGINGALSNHLESVIKNLSNEELSLTKIVFSALTERDGNRDVRRPTTVSQLAKMAGVSTSNVIELVNRFRGGKRNFLLPPTTTRLDDQTVVDISHESIIRKWSRLRKWVEMESISANTFTRILETATLWANGKAALWRSPDLENGVVWRDNLQPNRCWAERYGGDLDLVNRFLDLSLKNSQNETVANKVLENYNHALFEIDRRAVREVGFGFIFISLAWFWTDFATWSSLLLVLVGTLLLNYFSSRKVRALIRNAKSINAQDQEITTDPPIGFAELDRHYQNRSSWISKKTFSEYASQRFRNFCWR